MESKFDSIATISTILRQIDKILQLGHLSNMFSTDSNLLPHFESLLHLRPETSWICGKETVEMC